MILGTVAEEELNNDAWDNLPDRLGRRLQANQAIWFDSSY